MKFLFALLMLLSLTACNPEADLTYDQVHIDVTLEPDALYTAMNERDVIGIREPANMYSTAVMPLLYQTETKGYLMPTIPEEMLRRIPIRGMDAWHMRLVNLSHLEGNTDQNLL